MTGDRSKGFPLQEMLDRDERIAIAARTILGCCEVGDQMDDGFEKVMGSPELVEFRVATPTLDRCFALRDTVEAALCDSSFSTVSMGGECYLKIRVPVGAP